MVPILQILHVHCAILFANNAVKASTNATTSNQHVNDWLISCRISCATRERVAKQSEARNEAATWSAVPGRFFLHSRPRFLSRAIKVRWNRRIFLVAGIPPVSPSVRSVRGNYSKSKTPRYLSPVPASPRRKEFRNPFNFYDAAARVFTVFRWTVSPTTVKLCRKLRVGLAAISAGAVKIRTRGH